MWRYYSIPSHRLCEISRLCKNGMSETCGLDPWHVPHSREGRTFLRFEFEFTYVAGSEQLIYVVTPFSEYAVSWSRSNTLSPLCSTRKSNQTLNTSYSSVPSIFFSTQYRDNFSDKRKDGQLLTDFKQEVQKDVAEIKNIIMARFVRFLSFCPDTTFIILFVLADLSEIFDSRIFGCLRGRLGV